MRTSAANIGRSHRTSTWIADHENRTRLLPVGATGELLIEGHILCGGYLNRPDRTAEVFIRSPPWFESLRPNSMLYKTGDLVRYDADGSISFVGRKDTQVKMNCQRFELGEVEHALHLSLEPSCEPIVVELLKKAQQIEPNILVAFICVGRGIKDSGSEEGITPGNKDGHIVIATKTPETMAKLSSTSTPKSIWTPILPTPASSGGIGDNKSGDLCSSWSPEVHQGPPTIHNAGEAARACGLAPE
ncbi:hypothetical protein ACHAPU_010129 [Fusarium lateritium]